MNPLDQLSESEKLTLDHLVSQTLTELINEGGSSTRMIILEALVQVYLMGKENRINPEDA